MQTLMVKSGSQYREATPAEMAFALTAKLVFDPTNTRDRQVQLCSPPTHEELLRERTRFTTLLSWDDIAGLRQALEATSKLPMLRREARDIVARLLIELANAEMDPSS
jgi:hypothetical protein